MAIKREKVIRTAEKLVAKGKLEAAIKEYRKVLAENPNDANTLNRVGDLYARVEKFDEAVKLFSQIADQYTEDGFFVKAIAIYKKIIKLSPQSLQVYERLAELYYKQGLLNESRSQFQILADHYEKRDNATSAINIYQRMVEIDPDNPSNHLKLAKLFEGQQLTDKALRSYRQLADLFLVNGSIDEASQVYLSALDAHHGELEFVREVVRGLFDEGHREAAEKVLAKAKALNPAAEALGREVFAAPEPRAAAPAPAAPEDWEPPPPSSPADEEISFEVDAFELPGVTSPADAPAEFDSPAGFDSPAEFAAPEDLPRLADAMPAPAPDPSSLGFGADSGEDDEDDDSVFTLDLDSDEPTSTQVMPPPDMLEESAGSGEFDIDIESAEEASFEAEEVAEEIEEQEAPEAIDWSFDEAAEEPAAEIEAPVEIDIEIDEPALADEVLSAEPAAAEPAAAEPAAAEPAAAEPAAAPETMARHEDDLLAEAKVFAKYGLHDKAGDRLEELLGIQPEHLDGLALLTRIELDAGRHDEAAERAKNVARIAAASGRSETWNELLNDFAQAGHPLDRDDYEAVPGAEKEGDRFARLLEDLDETSAGLTVPADETSVELEPEPAGEPPEALDSPGPVPDELALDLEFEDRLFEDEPVEVAPAAPMPAAAQESAQESGQEPFAEIEALMKSVTRDAGFEEFVPEETSLEDLVPLDLPAEEDEAFLAEVEPAPAGPRKESHLVSLVDELDLGSLDDDEAPPDVAPAGEPPAAEREGAQAGSPDELDETGMSWLDEIAPPPAEADSESESIFDEEDDFFDLAAELEAEMATSEDEEVDLETAQEQSLEEIIDGFKRGVAENLSSEDYDTHYNLGIAYREMGLLDEAIGEFQLASKDPRYIVDCSSMLGICFLEKGLPELAVRWYKKGLESPALNEEQALGLLYDLGSAYVTMGDTESAYRTFVEIYGMNSNYRDVAHRIQELQQAVPSP